MRQPTPPQLEPRSAGRLYAASGRRTSLATDQVFDLTIREVDVYDTVMGRWSTLEAKLPTARAGAMVAVVSGRLVVIGGESMARR